MKLYYDRKAKDPIYYIQKGMRNGKKTTTKNVRRIGKHSELLAITSDPLTYAKEQVAEYNREYKAGKVDLSITLDLNEKLPISANIASPTASLNIGYFILQRLYQDLKLKSFFSDLLSESRRTFDANLVNRFLTFARILDPRSKLGTFDRLSSYFEQPACEYQHLLRFLDVLADNYDSYLEHLFFNSANIMKRNTAVCYFDCTNYYFEAEDEDGEYVDEVTGEVLKGLRKYGPSKEHRPNPIVQMGLFMDGDGIPLSMCISSGSDNEQKCALPLEQKLVKMFKGRPFIYCADAGLGSFNIRKYNDMGGRAYIVTQSVKKLPLTLRQAVFNDCGYRRLADDTPVSIAGMKEFDRFRPENRPLYEDTVYKIIEADHALDLGFYEDRPAPNGPKRPAKAKATLRQQIIVTFSRKALEYQRHIRNAQIERAQKLLATRNVEDVRKGPHDVARFIKRISTGKNGEKAADHYRIDQAAIEREEQYDGYYAVATNLQDDPRAILRINAQRYKIEDCFRILKTNFSARPVYHRNRKRIIAHFMVCYTALLLYRLLAKLLEQRGHHFSTDNILDTLRNMNVVNIHDEFYQAIYQGSQVSAALNDLYDLGLDKKHYLPKELNKTLKKISS